MGLITCTDCGKQVSDRATSCIHCGAPLGSNAKPEDLSDAVKKGHQRSQWRYEAGNAIGILGFLVGLILVLLSPALGITIMIGSVGLGLWFAYGS